MARAIFISYRRDDSEGEAGRLFDDLVRSFGETSVFMDVAGINPGIDFRKAIDDNVATCGVLLAVIGPQWATLTDGSGQRRLDNENDFVRLETASALARNIPVIPVLVHDAKMPRPDQLPDNLKDLAYRNSVEITHARWNSDVQLLTKALREYISPPAEHDTEPVHATVPVQLPAPNPPVEAGPVRGSRTPLIAGISLGIIAVIVVITLFAMRHSGRNSYTAQSVPSAVEPGGRSVSDVGTERTVSSLVGVWTDPSAKGHNTLAKLDISAAGDQLSIHAWGSCQDCDWGVQSTTFDGREAAVVWTLPANMGGERQGRVATVTLRPEREKLAVQVLNTFANGAPTHRNVEFVRAP